MYPDLRKNLNEGVAAGVEYLWQLVYFLPVSKMMPSVRLAIASKLHETGGLAASTGRVVLTPFRGSVKNEIAFQIPHDSKRPKG